eukprot:TRINITY_DN819_c0_g1_i2.p3 TRINITY_DN819_c0_g1~~TRINITY_DN819_c0_g1_i2.p3  ORF type:complete len:212 (-),score=33.52 TRINITY_DN819_c0_g1_i2:54-689(-)
MDCHTSAQVVAAVPAWTAARGKSRLRDSFAKTAEAGVCSEIVSLECPISRLPLKKPARGQRCGHAQCFDLNTYLLLNQQRPLSKWECPICKRAAPFGELVVDGYMSDVLLRCGRSAGAVTLLPSGDFVPVKSPAVASNAPAASELIDLSDDHAVEALARAPASKHDQSPRPVASAASVPAPTCTADCNVVKESDLGFAVDSDPSEDDGRYD